MNTKKLPELSELPSFLDELNSILKKGIYTTCDGALLDGRKPVARLNEYEKALLTCAEKSSQLYDKYCDAYTDGLHYTGLEQDFRNFYLLTEYYKDMAETAKDELWRMLRLRIHDKFSDTEQLEICEDYNIVTIPRNITHNKSDTIELSFGQFLDYILDNNINTVLFSKEEL